MPGRSVIAGFVLVLVGAAAGVATHAYLNRIRRDTEERQHESLRLRTLDLLNTDKSGTVLGPPTTTFESSTVKFVGWRATFDNRLHGSQSTRYRLDSTYKFPTGQSYTVDDCQMISETEKQVTFTGRIGNSKGGAFLPGNYTINFLLNGRPFTQKAFKVVTMAHAEPLVVSRIGIEGNQRIEKDAILIHIEQEPGQPLDPGVVDYDIRSIYKMGFFDLVAANLVYIKGQAVLVYRVSERPQVIEVRLEGMKAILKTDPRVVQAIKVHEGAILDPIAIRDTIEHLKNVYKNEGYINAQVTYASVARSDNTVISIFKVAETPQH